MSVVLPESMWAEIPMFRIFSMSLLMINVQSPVLSSIRKTLPHEIENCELVLGFPFVRSESVRISGPREGTTRVSPCQFRLLSALAYPTLLSRGRTRVRARFRIRFRIRARARARARDDSLPIPIPWPIPFPIPIPIPIPIPRPIPFPCPRRDADEVL